MLDSDFRTQVAEVLKFWIDFDVDNLFRIKSGIQRFRVPHEYETNSTKLTGLSEQGQRIFSEDSLQVAQGRLKELLGHAATQFDLKEDLVSAAIYAMALRQLSPEYERFTPHDTHLHTKLNRLFGMDPPTYLYQACDALLSMVKDELARHGITESDAAASTQTDG